MVEHLCSNVWNVVGSGHSDTERPHYQNRHFVSAHFGSVDSKERLAAH